MFCAYLEYFSSHFLSFKNFQVQVSHYLKNADIIIKCAEKKFLTIPVGPRPKKK
jgi:hypothetical protein